MSSIRAGSDPSDPNDPLHYAPRTVRSGTSPQIRPVRLASTRSGFDEMLNEAVAKSRRHPLDPVVVHEPEPRRARFRFAGGFAAAIGVLAIIGVVYFVMFPKSHGSDPTPAAANAAESHQDSDADSQALLQKFVQFEKSQDNPSPASAQPAPDESQALLQKFMQWQKKQ